MKLWYPCLYLAAILMVSTFGIAATDKVFPANFLLQRDGSRSLYPRGTGQISPSVEEEIQPATSQSRKTLLPKTSESPKQHLWTLKGSRKPFTLGKKRDKAENPGGSGPSSPPGSPSNSQHPLVPPEEEISIRIGDTPPSKSSKGSKGTSSPPQSPGRRPRPQRFEIEGGAQRGTPPSKSSSCRKLVDACKAAGGIIKKRPLTVPYTAGALGTLGATIATAKADLGPISAATGFLCTGLVCASAIEWSRGAKLAQEHRQVREAPRKRPS